MGKPDRAQLEDLVRHFTDAFNRDDLDEVMSFFTEGALYAEFNGQQNRGKEAIRKAFGPQFQGAFGEIRFHEQDIFIDDTEGSWGVVQKIDMVIIPEPCTLGLLALSGLALIRRRLK